MYFDIGLFYFRMINETSKTEYWVCLLGEIFVWAGTSFKFIEYNW